MLKLLGKLLNVDFSKPSQPIDRNVSEDEIWDDLHPPNSAETMEFKAAICRKKENIAKFIQFITSHLQQSETQRFVNVANKYLDEAFDSFDLACTSFDALAEAIVGGDDSEGQEYGQWVLIYIDWKNYDEISWQVSEILSLYGIDERWEYAASHEEHSSTLETLKNLSQWLMTLGFSLIHFDTGGDSYCGLIVKNTDVAIVNNLALAAELKIYDDSEFF